MRLFVWLMLFSSPAWAEAKRPVVCVAAFENQTSDASFDVLRKGLAEMVLTDLVASNLVDVVERERLEAVVAEQRLQRKGGFDPASVARVGKLLGASHAVVGSFQLEGAVLRLEVRVVEVQSGRVSAAAKVTGPRDALFSLQEQLVARLLEDLRVKADKVAVKPVGTADTLLDYSRALDSYDRGDLAGAASQIADVLQRAPGFELGQDFRLAVMKRLAAAADARASNRTRQRAALQAKAVAVLQGARRPLVSMGDLEASRHLTYRVIHAMCLGLGLEELLTPGEIRNVPFGRDATVAGLVASLRANLAVLGQELAEWKGPWKWFPEQPDVALLTALELKPPGDLLLQNSPGIVQRYEGELVLLGRVTLAAMPFEMRPSPAESDASLVDVGARLLEDAAAKQARAPATHGPLEQAVSCLEARALGLSRAGRTQLAVKGWQELLERYPQSPSFKRIEAQVKALVQPGREQLALAEEDRALAKAGCDRERVARAAVPVLARKDREAGLWGVWTVLDGLERQCGEALASWLGEQRVSFSAAHQDCARARAARVPEASLRRLAPSCVP